MKTGVFPRKNWLSDISILPSLRSGIHAHTVILYAEQYVHAVELEGFSGLSDNYFSMLPGEEKRVVFQSTDEMQSVEAYTLIPDRDEL